MKKTMKHWAVTGLIWAVLMYCINVFAFPAINGEEVTQRHMLVSIPVWLIGGLIFGYINYRLQTRKK